MTHTHIYIVIYREPIPSPKIEGRQPDSPAATGGTMSCHNDNRGFRHDATLPPPAASEVVLLTTCDATTDDKVGTTTTLCPQQTYFVWIYLLRQDCRPPRRIDIRSAISVVLLSFDLFLMPMRACRNPPEPIPDRSDADRVGPIPDRHWTATVGPHV